MQPSWKGCITKPSKPHTNKLQHHETIHSHDNTSVICDQEFEQGMSDAMRRGILPFPEITERYNVAPCLNADTLSLAFELIQRVPPDQGLPFAHYLVTDSSSNTLHLTNLGILEWTIDSLPMSFSLLSSIIESGRDVAVKHFLGLGGMSLLSNFIRTEHSIDVSRVFISLCNCDLYPYFDEDEELEDFIVNLLELEVEEITKNVVIGLTSLFVSSSRASFELSDVVFGHIENIVLHTGLDSMFLHLLSKCSFESFPLEIIGDAVESMLIECFRSDDERITSYSLDIFSKCFAFRSAWVEHGTLVDAVIRHASTGSHKIKKHACVALIEMSNACPLDHIIKLLEFNVADTLCEMTHAAQGELGLSLVECLGEIAGKVKTIFTDWLEYEPIQVIRDTLESIAEKDEGDMSAKALYELALLEGDHD